MWLSWALLLPWPAAAEVRVVEVVPQDRRILADEDGEFSGWIELLNDGGSPVNTRGYGLSLQPSEPFQWVLADRVLAPGERMLVFTSGKDRPGQHAPSPGTPFDPQAAGGLIWWLDSMDEDAFEAAAGPVARWRDKSGSSRATTPNPLDPAERPGLVGWLDASDPASLQLEGDRVLSWHDPRGEGITASAGIEIQRPVLQSDPASGRSAVFFDGTDDLLYFPALETVRTVVAVIREDAGASIQRRTLLGVGGASPLFRGPRATIYGDDFGTQGGSSRVWLDGRRVVPTQFPLPAGWVVLSTELLEPCSLDRLGADARGPGTFWQGEVGELLLFDRALATDERAGIEAFLQTKWGLAAPGAETRTTDATQAVAWRQPVRLTDPFLGMPVVRFDGEDDFLETERMTGIRTVFWVLHQTTGPGLDDGALLGDTAKLGFLRGSEGVLLSVLNASYHAKEGVFRINGERVDPLTARLPAGWAVVECRTTGPTEADALGTSLLRPGPNWAGEFAEVLVYDQPLSDSQMNELRSGLAAKWGIPALPPHARFQLPDEPALITLTAPGGRLVDWTTCPALPPDCSYGRSEPEDGAPEQEWSVFVTPTPGAANGLGYPGFAPPPAVEPPSGSLGGGVTVTMTPPWPGSEIYYTLDGSAPAAPSEAFQEVLWLDDTLPSGAAGTTDQGRGWEWVRAGDAGGLAHRSPNDPGLRHHYLYGANPPLLVREEDRLFADVWLNPEAPPSEVMMAWYDGSSDHRAYWGANLIAQGLPGTAGRFRAGDLPPAGQWTRLEVAAADVGLGDSARVSGMTFLAFGGEVLWDRSGRLTQHAGGSRRYEEALELDATTVVRAVTVAEGTVPGGEAIRTYVLDFASGLPVVSLAVDSPDLFSVESGLLVLGTNASPSAPYLGANFWRDWEREGWLTVMEPDGTVVEHGGVGVRVQGGWSRSAPQKSLSLRARERYGRGRIAWRVFPELALQSFDSLVLRNSGNDWRHARTRDGLLQGLMRGTAVDMTAFRPAQVFLNGEYWGILNLRERTDGAYLMGHHPEIPDEDAVDLIEDDQKALEGDLTEFLKLAGFIDRHTLEDPEDYAALLNWIDLDNYLDWICTELFVDNRDWPGHNVRCWRPRRPEGRWRWILNDLDSSFSLSGEGAERPTLELVAAPVELGAYGGRSTELFRRLLNNPEGREAFLQRFAGLLATRFSSETVRAHIDEVAALLTPEMPWQIARWANSNEPGWPPLPSMEEWFAKLDELRTVAGVRPGSVRQQVVDYFHLPGIVSVTVEVVSGWRGRLWLGREPLEPAGGAIQFDWPAGVLLRLTAEPGVGSRFLGWNDPEEPSPVIEVVPSGPLQLTARFDADDDFDPATLEPPPWPLWSSRYELDGFGPQTPAGSQPTSAEFRQTPVKDPSLDAETTALWSLPYDLDSQSRIVGLDGDGVGFINTGSARIEDGGGFVGALRLSLQTSGVTGVTVDWVGGTVLPNSREYALRLQWRVGDAACWQDVLDATGRPVEYLRHSDAGHETHFGPVTLPAEADNQLLVQLRWKYHALPTGATGARAFLRLDDIHVDGQRWSHVAVVQSVTGGANGFETLLDALPHSAWRVEESDDLRAWRAVGELQANASGRLRYSRPEAPEGAARFFRFLPSEP